MVIFFDLTNLPEIFQTIINKILQDLINTKEITRFINNIIIKIEKKKEYNEIIKEVVKRLADNNLYIKHKRKIKKVGFLEVVIKPKGIKIEKVKVKMVLNQPTSKRIKDIQKFLGLTNYYRQFIKDFITIIRLLYDFVKNE